MRPDLHPEDFDGISLPIQNLYDNSGRRMVSVDISNGLLSIGEVAGNAGKCYRLHLDKKTGFPVVKARLAISSSERKAALKGNLIVDFGNPMLVFLMSQHKSVRFRFNERQMAATPVESGAVKLSDLNGNQ